MTDQISDEEIGWQLAMGEIKKTFFIDQIRKLLNQLGNEEISFSRFVEILNVEAEKSKREAKTP